MSHQTEYDLRMRSYKSITDAHLIPRTPVIIQIDGRAFHTFTRGFKKPFDQVYELLMCYLMLLNDQNKLWIFGFCRFSLHTELI